VDLPGDFVVRLWRRCLLTIMLGVFGLPRIVAGQAEPACPSPALDRLATIRGAWIVRWFYRLAPGKYATSMARSTIRPTAGGCGLLERFDGMRGGRPFEALTLIAPAGGDSLQRVWQDSEHGAILLFTTDLQADPLRFEWSRDLGDRVLRLRTTYLVLTAEGFATETELSPDGGQSWQLVSRQEYRRSGS
jgi:hypothetical protein